MNNIRQQPPNNTHYNQLTRLYKKIQEKYGQCYKYLQAMRKSMQYLQELPQSTEGNTGQQIGRLRGKISGHVDKLMLPYMQGLNIVDDLYRKMNNEMEQLCQKIGGIQDCQSWRMEQCENTIDNAKNLWIQLTNFSAINRPKNEIE